MPKTSSIFTLDPFLDSDSILKVGDRLNKGKFDHSKQHPTILPKGHSFTKLIVLDMSIISIYMQAIFIY